MNDTNPALHTSGSAAIGGALTTILVGSLGMCNIALSSGMTAAIGIVLTSAAGYVIHRFFKRGTNENSVPTKPAA